MSRAYNRRKKLKRRGLLPEPKPYDPEESKRESERMVREWTEAYNRMTPEEREHLRGLPVSRPTGGETDGRTE